MQLTLPATAKLRTISIDLRTNSITVQGELSVNEGRTVDRVWQISEVMSKELQDKFHILWQEVYKEAKAHSTRELERGFGGIG